MPGAYRTPVTGTIVYVPVHKDYVFEEVNEGTQLVPLTIFEDAATVPFDEYPGDPALRLQLLLPDNLSFDMAVNIFDPGGHLLFVETHIMEHGLLYLQGQGIYMPDHHWYPVLYIYYKNVNRFPIIE